MPTTAGAFYDKSYECDNIAPGCPFVTHTCSTNFVKKANDSLVSSFIQ